MAARSRSFEPNIGAVLPSWLEPRLGTAALRVLDVRGAQDYARGHVPGAIALAGRELLYDAYGQVVSAPELALAMSGAGVGDTHTVVVVDDGTREAALAAAWALARYGHRDVHVLEGGFTRWTAERREVSRQSVRHSPASYTARNPA